MNLKSLLVISFVSLFNLSINAVTFINSGEELIAEIINPHTNAVCMVVNEFSDQYVNYLADAEPKLSSQGIKCFAILTGVVIEANYGLTEVPSVITLKGGQCPTGRCAIPMTFFSSLNEFVTSMIEYFSGL